MLDIILGTAQRHRALTVFPLCTPGPVELPYQLLVDALHAQSLRITEVGSGTVPELQAENLGADPVFVVDGEQLIGARQNRMTNRSLLLRAHSKTLIPVSCMEQGRWHFVSDQFAASPQHSPSKVRRQAREVESEQAATGAPVPQAALSQAQGRVWESIAEHAGTLGAHSATGALNEIYDSRANDLNEWVRSFPAVEGQVGLLAFLGGRPLGLDVIGGRTLYARVHERLVRGYAMDGLATRSRAREVLPGTAQQYLDEVREAGRIASPTAGQGIYHILSGAVVGGELLDRERVAHLSAFPAAPASGRGRAATHSDVPAAPVPPPSRRRRNRES